MVTFSIKHSESECNQKSKPIHVFTGIFSKNPDILFQKPFGEELPMCTAITFKTRDCYFGRTLDYDFAYPVDVTITPRNFPLPFRHLPTLSRHHALIGMAHVIGEYPLYFDAVNEYGLSMAGLNFPGYAVYSRPFGDRDTVAVFEFLPWLLGQCANIREARKLLESTHLTDTPFSDSLPTTPLHWILADRKESIVIEPLCNGLKIWSNPAGILTNNPPFEQQMLHLTNYMHLSPEEPQNRFAPQLALLPYSLGMGAAGLPGDLSSQSRFVRAAFTKLNSRCGDSETESINQFFHILGTVEQVRGCCRTAGDSCEITHYTSCCNISKGYYYYSTYRNHQISCVGLRQADMEGSSLLRFPTDAQEQIRMQN